MSAEPCPVCASQNTARFLQRQQVPVHQNLVLADQASALAVARGDLHMAACGDCGFVFNSAFDLSRLAYGAQYDNTQSHSAMFDAYLDGLVELLVKRHGVRNARIVEIGCGKGHFLRKLVAYPGAGNTGFGFDPSYVGPDSDLDGRLEFRRRFYDADCVDIPADVVVCRHVIEHVPRPVDLLDSVHAALANQPAARVYFETPCVQWILQNRVLWDFFYEHCSLFCADSLRTAFERSRFVVESVEHVFGGQYLWLQARPAASTERLADRHGAHLAGLAQAYAVDERRLCQTLQHRLRTLRQQGPVALWGAGAKGVTFANLVDPSRGLLDCLVDINPAKQGCFVAGTGHPIVEPAALGRHGVGNVVLMNPNYRPECLQRLEAVRCSANLIDWS